MENTEAEESKGKSCRKPDTQGNEKNNMIWKIQKQNKLQKTKPIK